MWVALPGVSSLRLQGDWAPRQPLNCEKQEMLQNICHSAANTPPLTPCYSKINSRPLTLAHKTLYAPDSNHLQLLSFPLSSPCHGPAPQTHGAHPSLGALSIEFPLPGSCSPNTHTHTDTIHFSSFKPQLEGPLLREPSLDQLGWHTPCPS